MSRLKVFEHRHSIGLGIGLGQWFGAAIVIVFDDPTGPARAVIPAVGEHSIWCKPAGAPVAKAGYGERHKSGGAMGLVVAAILIAGILSILTDWLFMGMLFREAQGSYPEVWWPAIRDGETVPAKIWTALLGFVTATAMVLLCLAADVHGIGQGLIVGLLAFLAGPPVLLLTALQFVKIDWWLILANSLAWGARMLIAGAVAGLVLP